MRKLYLEVFWPESPLSNWRAFVSDHDETVYRKELGGNVSKYSQALWPCFHRFIEKTAVVVVVSNASVDRQKALDIANKVVNGKTILWQIELPKTWWD